MTLTRILTYVLFAVSLYLGYYLYSSIQDTIDTRTAIAAQEANVIERLQLIREAENVYLEVNKKYTSSWDSLISFIQNGQVPIVEKREEIIPKAYGGEEVIIHIDTLGFISVRDRIFKETFNINAAESGTFIGYRVKVGDRVIKNQRAYALRVDGKVSEPPFAEEGVVSNLANVSVGSQVSDGQPLITLTDERFDSNVNISSIGEIPGWNDGRKFDIFTGTVDKGGLKLQVIEVIDATPVNPERKEGNEHKARKPLRFGSRSDVTTAGNWE